MSEHSAQIKLLSDREILHMMEDLRPGGKAVSARDLALRMFGLSDGSDPRETLHAIRCFSSRLSWMTRFGLVAKLDNSHPAHWTRTALGEALRKGRINRDIKQHIAFSDATTLAYHLAAMGDRYIAAGVHEATLLRREWQHQHNRRLNARR